MVPLSTLVLLRYPSKIIKALKILAGCETILKGKNLFSFFILIYFVNYKLINQEIQNIKERLKRESLCTFIYSQTCHQIPPKEDQSRSFKSDGLCSQVLCKKDKLMLS